MKANARIKDDRDKKRAFRDISVSWYGSSTTTHFQQNRLTKGFNPASHVRDLEFLACIPPQILTELVQNDTQSNYVEDDINYILKGFVNLTKALCK